jgi:hypothetical protein
MEFIAERFSDLDLSMLPFTVDAAARDRIDHAGRAFDAARPDSARWQSWSLPATSSPGIPMAFLTTVVLPSSSSDWAEIDLGAEYETPTSLRITCEMQVECWCSTDHNMHIVEQHGWLAGDEQTLATTFDQAAAPGIQWLDADLDPDHLRRRAGLPARA